MPAFIISFVLSFIFYLALSAGSGSVLLWSAGELAFGALFAGIAALLARKLFSVAGFDPGWKALNPARWAVFAAYAIGPLLFAMARANLDVAYRVVTGKIRPGIVRVRPGMRTGFGTALLANSVTLTPGTLAVDARGGDLYVHWLNVRDKSPKARDVCSSFPAWIRRFAE